MTKEEIMKKIDFNNDGDTEIKDADFYLKVKGVALHKEIMLHLGINFDDSKQKIKWSKISSLLRYDKKLRDKIYIYIATLEEYMRAYLGNKYEDAPNQPFWKDCGRDDNRRKVKTRILKGENVSDVLNSIEFGDLVLQIKNIPSNDKSEIFGCVENINLNLDAVQKLRNAVSHHRFLMDYKFLPCVVDEKKDDSLEYNIRNLRQLLPKEYRNGKNGKNGITAEINACQYEKRVINKKNIRQLMLIDDRDIVHLD
jgi:hypothetical protein